MTWNEVPLASWHLARGFEVLVREWAVPAILANPSLVNSFTKDAFSKRGKKRADEGKRAL